jgi:hypothetical protein
VLIELFTAFAVTVLPHRTAAPFLVMEVDMTKLVDVSGNKMICNPDVAADVQNKKAALAGLADALSYSRAGVKSLDYDWQSETVQVRYGDGTGPLVNIAADSVLAMLQDIISRIK